MYVDVVYNYNQVLECGSAGQRHGKQSAGVHNKSSHAGAHQHPDAGILWHSVDNLGGYGEAPQCPCHPEATSKGNHHCVRRPGALVLHSWYVTIAPATYLLPPQGVYTSNITISIMHFVFIFFLSVSQRFQYIKTTMSSKLQPGHRTSRKEFKSSA